jgi:hypothetical protein
LPLVVVAATSAAVDGREDAVIGRVVEDAGVVVVAAGVGMEAERVDRCRIVARSVSIKSTAATAGMVNSSYELHPASVNVMGCVPEETTEVEE